MGSLEQPSEEKINDSDTEHDDTAQDEQPPNIVQDQSLSIEQSSNSDLDGSISSDQENAPLSEQLPNSDQDNSLQKEERAIPTEQPVDSERDLQTIPNEPLPDVQDNVPSSEKPKNKVDESYITSSPYHIKVSSSLPKVFADDAGRRRLEGLPQNCSYDAKKVDWKKIYSPIEGAHGEVTLLKDQRCETDFFYGRGSLEDTGEKSAVSDTDILTHGLNVLLKTREDSVKTLHLPNLRNVLNLMQLSPEELSSLQEWLDQKYELSQSYEKETCALLTFVKKLLKEVKHLRENTAKYRKQIQNLEGELSLYPSAERLSDLYKESDKLRKEIIKLDRQHGEIIRSKNKLDRSIQIEFQNCSKSGNSLYLRVQNLKYENKTLRHLVEVFTNEAREVSDSLIKKLEASLKIIKRLDGLLLRARKLLEKKYSQTKEIEKHLNDQDKLIDDIVNSIDLIQDHIANLKTNVDSMQNKSASLTSHAVNLQNEINQLLGNFNSLSTHLSSQNELEEDKKINMSQVKQILNSLELQKKNAKKLEKNIAKLEKHVHSSEAKDRKDGESIVGTSEKENEKERLSWESKILKLRSYFEEMDEVMINIKEQEAERRKKQAEENRKDAIGEAFAHAGEETVRLSGRFICSDASAGEVVTKSGVCKIAETSFPEESEKRVAGSPLYGRGVKSAYAVGLQNLSSVPESAESQLHGIYAKYKLKDSKETHSALPSQSSR